MSRRFHPALVGLALASVLAPPALASAAEGKRVRGEPVRNAAKPAVPAWRWADYPQASVARLPFRPEPTLPDAPDLSHDDLLSAAVALDVLSTWTRRLTEQHAHVPGAVDDVRHRGPLGLRRGHDYRSRRGGG